MLSRREASSAQATAPEEILDDLLRLVSGAPLFNPRPDDGGSHRDLSSAKSALKTKGLDQLNGYVATVTVHLGGKGQFEPVDIAKQPD